jgi:hypothetical protein
VAQSWPKRRGWQAQDPQVTHYLFFIIFKVPAFAMIHFFGSF